MTEYIRRFLYFVVSIVIVCASLCGGKEINYACRLLTQSNEALEPIPRVIIVGDVHGSLQGLSSILFRANITSSVGACVWNPDAVNTILVQVGDIVDRGPEALEAWVCLDSLQKQTNIPLGSKVVRMIGNHELWWLEGRFHQRNAKTDTIEKVTSLVVDMKRDIISGFVVGSYVLRVHGVDVIFTHSGLRPAFLSHIAGLLDSAVSSNSGDRQNSLGAQTISDYINEKLRSAIVNCHSFRCNLDDETFEAGKDRGGSHIGGPFWTDFDVIDEAVRNKEYLDFSYEMIQVAGHTMAWCYSPSRPNFDPPMSFAECSLGLVRSTPKMEAICVDGGMYAGGWGFLEVDVRGHFIRHQRLQGEWSSEDLTQVLCTEDLSSFSTSSEL